MIYKEWRWRKLMIILTILPLNFGSKFVGLNHNSKSFIPILSVEAPVLYSWPLSLLFIVIIVIWISTRWQSILLCHDHHHHFHHAVMTTILCSAFFLFTFPILVRSLCSFISITFIIAIRLSSILQFTPARRLPNARAMILQASPWIQILYLKLMNRFSSLLSVVFTRFCPSCLVMSTLSYIHLGMSR